MMRKIYSLLAALLCSIAVMQAADVTYSPVLDVNFRTGAGNTAWNSGFPKSAADEGNVDFELTYAAGLFALQKYTIADIQSATKLVLTLTVGSKSGVDAVKVWPFANNTWTAESGIDDLLGVLTTTVGIAPRDTEGTANTPPVSGKKVSGSDPAQATFTITGDALAAIKASASSDGTFTLLLTNNDLTNSNNKRSYLSVNSANAESARPQLVATTEKASVINKTTGVGYATLEEAFNAAVEAETDAELEVSGDQKLSKRLTLNKAISITITPTADITVKGPKNAMWFLVNTNKGEFRIGSAGHKMTLDGNGDDRSSYNNVDVTRRENNTSLYLTNLEFKNFICGANHLVGCKNAGGAIYLEDVTFNGCSSTDALVSNLREANDALLLKGYLNVENCTGTTIYTAKNRIRLGDPDGTKIYSDFSASNVITIAWGGEFAEGTLVVVKVPGSAKDKFRLVSDEWSLAHKSSNGDLYMTKGGSSDPTATVKIGNTEYEDLSAALAAAGEEATITLLADQELKARVNIKDQKITITGGKAVKRAAGYKNGLIFLTQAASEGKESTLILDGITLDGQNADATAAFIEASNKGTTTLKNVTLKNCKNLKEDASDAAIIVNKTGGKLNLDGVTFTDCTANNADIFVGTSNVTVAGNNTIGSILVTANYSLKADGATAASPVTILTDDSRTYGMLVEGGDASQFTCAAFRLSQQQDGVYAMPLPVAASLTHPALLHSADDINAVKARLDSDDLAKAAYSRLEAQSGGTAAGAVEYLKRMDKANWESKYSDYSNFSRAATDGRLAYQLALRYQLKGSTAAADAAVKILNDWATVNKGLLRLSGYANGIPDPNEYLITIQAYQFANAAELLRSYGGWAAADFQKFQQWIRQTFADVAILFLENHHNQKNALHYWLNWDLAALNAMLSVGILCDDKALIDYALAYPTTGQGTGNVENAIAATHQDPDSEEMLAQCQESGRDQGHATLDISLLGVLCQTAKTIGTDLFTPYKALEMAEYVGKYNLKDAAGNFVYAADKVPFNTYNNGEIEHTAISADQRGTARPCWELFHAYAKASGKADAYTEAWVKYWRATNTWGEGEASATDELGFGSLMFGAAVSGSDTGIKEMKTTAADGEAYDLQGRRIADKQPKGVYILNGKKMIGK